MGFNYYLVYTWHMKVMQGYSYARIQLSVETLQCIMMIWWYHKYIFFLLQYNELTVTMVSDVFEKVRVASQPCLLFFDEVDFGGEL